MMAHHDIFSNLEDSEKQRHWDNAAEHVRRIVDTLGQPIDESIFEGVVALEVLNINTNGSCEGHVDRGTYAPYLDIQANFPRDMLVEFKELLKDREKNKSRIRELNDSMEGMNLAEQVKIVPYLDAFYRDREVPFQRRLVLENVALGRLESQGARFQKIESEAVRAERLREYQEEMHAFALFLKEKYFSEEVRGDG